jgi:hypothetical protein
VLQLDLDIIHHWCLEWLLFLNVQKCHVLHFGNKEQLLNKFNYNINGQYLNESVVEKDLGVFVSSDLNWDKQVSQVCSSDLIRKLYTTLIRPKLEYANVIWFPSAKKHVLMLEKVQRRCTKIGPLRGLHIKDWKNYV